MVDPVHAALLQRMLGPGAAAGPGPPPGGPPGRGNGAGLSPLQATQSVIQDLHDLMRILPDPQSVSVAATCLKAMTGLQQQLMAPQQGGGGPMVTGGGGPGGPS
jgi:hypothetical protein